MKRRRSGTTTETIWKPSQDGLPSWEHLLNASADLFAICNRHGEIKRINRAWQEYLHASPEALLATRFPELVQEADRSTVVDIFSNLADGHASPVITLSLVTPIADKSSNRTSEPLYWSFYRQKDHCLIVGRDMADTLLRKRLTRAS